MTKRVVLISDMSGLGNCSAGAAVAVISSMGNECVFVPTAILSAQTGFKDHYTADMTHHLNGFLTSIDKITPINTYYIGFLQSSETAEKSFSIPVSVRLMSSPRRTAAYPWYISKRPR
ncbi:MAG: hypothetical protein II440_06880, partial [Clostridia bacterium]|nr:hypothetical protein [Clostridia bacterium]